MNRFDRRSFLIGSGAALALAACSDSKASLEQNVPDGFALAQRFNQEFTVTGTVRLPFSLANGQTMLSDGPKMLYGKILADDHSTVVIPAISAKRREVTEGISYYDFHPTFETPGTYYLVVAGGDEEGGAISVNDPASVSIPFAGKQLPPFDTPTTENVRGVNPICTRLTGGPCPFHAMTLTAALQSGKPVAYLIGTPAHCQFGTCAPGLEFLIEAHKQYADQISFVHAEVYVDDSATVTTPAVDAYGLTFEPCLFLTDPTGKVVTRLDAAWDQSELNETLATLVA